VGTASPLTGDTIAALATAPGRGGVAVVRVSGPEAFAVARKVTGRAVSAADAGRFFHVKFFSASGGVLDDGLLLVAAGPRSYTGEDVVEFQTHGGRVTPKRVLDACFAAGCRTARRGEYTERAFLNGRLGLGEAEAVIDLIDAKSERAADDALARLGGASRALFEKLYADALALSADLEHALDFDEGELPADFFAAARVRLDALREAVAAARRTAGEGRLLREGAVVVLAGPPNAGKSSLMNALLGEARVIVSDTAGTTRDSVEEGLVVDGWPVRLVDTAGLRQTADAVEAEGVARAEKLVADADVVLALDCDVAGAIRIHSKCDLGRGEGLNVSAKTGEGLDALRAAIAAALEKRAAEADESGAALTDRQAETLAHAARSLVSGAEALAAGDIVLAANAVREASETLGALIGKTYADDLLDAVFSRFCVGK